MRDDENEMMMMMMMIAMMSRGDCHNSGQLWRTDVDVMCVCPHNM